MRNPRLKVCKSQWKDEPYLQQHDVIDFGMIVWVADGCFHRDDLLGSFTLLDVVGAQDDCDGPAQRQPGTWRHSRYSPGARKRKGQLGAVQDWSGEEF